MTLAVFALLGATIMVSSFISGVFGMAGGLILLGVLLHYFDVPAAMILFSIIQFFANGWRALQWRAYVRWPIFAWYVAGAALAFAGMYSIRFVPDKMMVYLSLGLMPFVVEALPRALRPNIEWRGAVITGSPASAGDDNGSLAGEFATGSPRRCAPSTARRLPAACGRRAGR